MFSQISPMDIFVLFELEPPSPSFFLAIASSFPPCSDPNVLDLVMVFSFPLSVFPPQDTHFGRWDNPSTPGIRNTGKEARICAEAVGPPRLIVTMPRQAIRYLLHGFDLP